MTRRATIAIAAVGAAYFLAACGAGCRKDAPSQAGPAGLPVVKTQLGVEMVAVLAGEFEMGSADGPANERPTHRVHVEAFLMDRTEVTQEQFQKLRVPDPSHFKGPQRPVERVTWIEAVKFCNERSTAEGLAPCYRFDEAAGRWLCDFDADGYRLPTEAEWEYACRAGTSGLRSFDAGEQDLSRYAWFADNAAKSTHPVAQKAANPWGLFDLYGNVAEWCNDLYDGGYYAVSPPREPRGPADSPAGQVVVRGGAWSSKADACRSAWRAGENPRVADACFARRARINADPHRTQIKS